MHKTLMLGMVILSVRVAAGASLSTGGPDQILQEPRPFKECLQGSGGSYTLTADSGTVYQLIRQHIRTQCACGPRSGDHRLELRFHCYWLCQ